MVIDEFCACFVKVLATCTEIASVTFIVIGIDVTKGQQEDLRGYAGKHNEDVA
jgi:hypothetical protein